MGKLQIYFRAAVFTVMALMAVFLMPAEDVKAETLKSTDIEQKETRDEEAFRMIIGLADRCPYLGSIEGSFVYGTQTYVYIANNVHKTNKADVYYSTCALEFSRQKDENKYTDTSGNSSDYFRYRNNGDSISSVVLCSPNFNEQAYINNIKNNDGTLKEAASFQISDFNTRFLSTKDDIKVASFVDARMTKNGDKYVSTYFIIKEETLSKLISKNDIFSWRNDFNTVIDKNPDNEDYYWLKMNKILTTHSPKGFVSCVTNYSVQDENTTLNVKGNPAYTGSGLVASVRSALKDGPLTNFDKLCVIADGGKFTDSVTGELGGQILMRNLASELSAQLGMRCDESLVSDVLRAPLEMRFLTPNIPSPEIEALSRRVIDEFLQSHVREIKRLADAKRWSLDFIPLTFIGGTSQILSNEIRAVFGDTVTIAENPEYVNALGFLRRMVAYETDTILPI